MRIARTIVVLDAADLGSMSSFWSRMLGGRVDTGDDWHTISVDGEPRMGIQLAPRPRATAMARRAPQQIHLDLYVEDVAAAHEEAMALGAELLQEAADLSAKPGFQVYADPAGHCLCWG